MPHLQGLGDGGDLGGGALLVLGLRLRELLLLALGGEAEGAGEGRQQGHQQGAWVPWINSRALNTNELQLVQIGGQLDTRENANSLFLFPIIFSNQL